MREGHLIAGLHPDSPNPFQGEAAQDPSAHLKGVVMRHPFLSLQVRKVAEHEKSGQVTWPLGQMIGTFLQSATSLTHCLSMHWIGKAGSLHTVVGHLVLSLTHDWSRLHLKGFSKVQPLDSLVALKMISHSALVLAQVPDLSHLTGFSLVHPLYMGHSSSREAHDPI